MELDSENIAGVLYPIAAFGNLSTSSNDVPYKAPGRTQLNHIPWETSMLNPKNRIDSLAEPLNAKWIVDGSAGNGTQFYTVPTFLRRRIPMRIDTFIPERKEILVALQSDLGIGSAFYTRDGRVAQLGIARYIVRVLDHWSGQIPDFEAFYHSLPFGSRIMFQNVEADIRAVRIQILQTHFLEKQLLSIESLRAMWNIPPASWPENTDLADITLVKQLHDSVSLVKHAGQTRIMKSLTSSPKYLYHELKVLLTMEPHPNIVSKPPYLIVKRCNFGGKIAVVGFLLDYYSAGTLRDVLSFRRASHSLRLQDQIKWSIQLTEALVHIRADEIMYCDLRLDNIVLAEPGERLVMIDFEARGVGTFTSAPEINYLEYILSLAHDTSESIAENEHECFQQLREIAINGRSVPALTEMYRNPQHGYCISWLCLSEAEREAAQVYMLGKVLWGIFEGVGSPDKGVLVEHCREDAMEFPQWRNTPAAIRELISACCVCSKPRTRFPLVRKGRRLCLRNADGEGTADQVRDAAVRWWRDELRDAREFVEQRTGGSAGVGHISSSRPKLEDVLVALKSFSKISGQ